MNYRTSYHFTALVVILIFSLSGLSCASGSKTRITLSEAKVPVSMSRSVRDESGAIVKLKDLDKLGKFESTLLSWSIFYEVIPLFTEKDISKDINEQVQKAKGEALVNTTIETRACSLISIPILSVLPFWPTCSITTVSAEIESRKMPAKRGLSQ